MCEASQYSDQMVCHKCNICWDTNDPDPPPCPNDGELIQPGVLAEPLYTSTQRENDDDPICEQQPLPWGEEDHW